MDYMKAIILQNEQIKKFDDLMCYLDKTGYKISFNDFSPFINACPDFVRLSEMLVNTAREQAGINAKVNMHNGKITIIK